MSENRTNISTDPDNGVLNPDLVDIGRQLIKSIGEDPDRQGLLRTPERFARSWEFLNSGYDTDMDALINDAIFNEDYDEIVTVKNINFFSLCEHHMLPFFGKVSVAYIPRGKIIGLSKIPRIVKAISRRLQIQERMTRQIAQVLDDKLSPLGVAVVIEAEHMCMAMRGVEAQNSKTTTSELVGAFKNSSKSRAEVMQLFALDMIR